MSTVCAAPLFLCLVNLDVRNVERIHIQTFHLPKAKNIKLKTKKTWFQNFTENKQCYLSIAFSILKQIQDELSGLNRPAPLSIWVSVLCLSSSTYTPAESGERYGLLVGKHILQIPLGLDQRKLPDSVCGLPSVLYKWQYKGMSLPFQEHHKGRNTEKKINGCKKWYQVLI